MCKHSRRSFCFICASYLPKDERYPIDNEIEKLFYKCYHYKLVINWSTPKSVCIKCIDSMCRVVLGYTNRLIISSPAIFIEFNDVTHDNCFFCLAKPGQGFPFNASVLEPVFN